MITTGAILTNVGAVAIIWGVFWALWDNRANAPMVLLSTGIGALLVGAVIS